MKELKKKIFGNTIFYLSNTKDFDDKTPEKICASWKGIFRYNEGKINDVGEIVEKGLRAPQIGALHAFMADNQNDNEASLIVMPTGTGKTETMLSILIAARCNKLLVVVPSDPLRTQISKKFISLGLLPEIGVLDGGNFLYPKVGVVKKKMELKEWRYFIKECNVVITTMSILALSKISVKNTFVSLFSNVFIDEAHHIEAKTWSDFASIFNQNSLTLFTATPFRNDGKKLRGKIIYNFSLREAQAQNYYKPITLLPVYGYTQEDSDLLISRKAISQLRKDLENKFDHILMARCKDKQRANEVFKYYENEKDLNPIIIHSNVPNKNSILEEIKRGKHKIIVCVNMLGEGYDLPELKIAALHDSRKSLPIMLQFIGRFTRTAVSKKLGTASFVINVADPPSLEKLEQLYRQDADWDCILPRINEEVIDNDLAMRNFLNGFSSATNINEISLENITPAFSALIYKVGNNWYPQKCKEIISSENWEYVRLTENTDGDTIILLLGRKVFPEWTKQDITSSIQWEIIVVHRHCTPKYCHAYVNSSTKAINIDRLMVAIFGDAIDLIYGPQLFRVFHNMKRLGVTMFGGRKSIPGSVSFKSFCGKDIEDGISQIEAGQLVRNNVFGIGYKDGERDSIGCTIKGKIWSLRRDNLYKFTKWCHEIGGLVENATLDPDVVMRNALKVKRLSNLPNSRAIAIDWNDSLWKNTTRKFEIIEPISKKSASWDEVSLEIFTRDENSDDIRFAVKFKDVKSEYRYILSDASTTGFLCTQITGPKLSANFGTSNFPDISLYFQKLEGVPTFFFTDGEILQGTYLAEIRTQIPLINNSQLIPIDWADTILSKESQNLLENPDEYKSIQYFFSKYLEVNDNFDILYDDDGAGEIADLITIKDEPNALNIGLYHLKYASGGQVNNSISNLYEVCGQAMRSLKWHNQDLAKTFFSHLISRQIKNFKGSSASRLLKGNIDSLHRLGEQARYNKKMKFNISIVQPSISSKNASEELLRLLGCVSNYIEDVANIKIKVYCSF